VQKKEKAPNKKKGQGKDFGGNLMFMYFFRGRRSSSGKREDS